MIQQYNNRPQETGAHKEFFAIAFMIFSQKCYGVFIDNVTALMYNYFQDKSEVTVIAHVCKRNHHSKIYRQFI